MRLLLPPSHPPFSRHEGEAFLDHSRSHGSFCCAITPPSFILLPLTPVSRHLHLLVLFIASFLPECQFCEAQAVHLTSGCTPGPSTGRAHSRCSASSTLSCACLCPAGPELSEDSTLLTNIPGMKLVTQGARAPGVLSWRGAPHSGCQLVTVECTLSNWHRATHTAGPQPCTDSMWGRAMEQREAGRRGQGAGAECCESHGCRVEWPPEGPCVPWAVPRTKGHRVSSALQHTGLWALPTEGQGTENPSLASGSSGHCKIGEQMGWGPRMQAPV